MEFLRLACCCLHHVMEDVSCLYTSESWLTCAVLKGKHVQCPKMNCKSNIKLLRWNSGHSDGHCPRLLHDVTHMVVLVPAIYVCDNGHEILSTNPYILKKITEGENIPSCNREIWFAIPPPCSQNAAVE